MRVALAATTAMRRKLDQAAKQLFVGDVFADALQAAMPEVAARLRLETMEPLPTEYIGPDRIKRFGDAAFRVTFRKSRFPPTGAPGAQRRGRRSYLLLAGEFQNRNEGRMAHRVREYALWMEEHYRHQGVIREGEHPPVLALVIHTGSGRWTAPNGMEFSDVLPKRAARQLAAYQPQAYIALDAGRHSTLDLLPGNRLRAAARLAGRASARELAERLAEEWKRFGGTENARFRRGMLAWAEEAVLGFPESGVELPDFDELEGLEEKDMAFLLEDCVQEWKAEWREEGRDEGERVGRAKGERDLLERLAERRFGAEAARRLSTALNGTPSRERLTDLADLVVRCETAEDFVAQLDD